MAVSRDTHIRKRVSVLWRAVHAGCLSIYTRHALSNLFLLFFSSIPYYDSIVFAPMVLFYRVDGVERACRLKHKKSTLQRGFQ